MNKILIVGHPASGCHGAEALLHQCGMHAARPSRREQLQPNDITATLCKAHNAPPAETVVAEEDFQQIEAGPVWHGMALDLMLGNLDQALWGWADPQAIYALNYWKELDPKLTFVLVYDEPQRVLMEAAAAGGQPPTATAVQQMLDNWTAYNGALLRFFLRNSGRCLLVHSQQVRRAVDAYLQQLQPLLDTPLTMAAPALSADAEQLQGAPALNMAVDAGLDISDNVTPALLHDVSTQLPADLALAVATAGLEREDAAGLINAEAAERFLLGNVLASYPAAQQLYAELQSAANLPLEGSAASKGDPAMAWTSLVQQRAFMSRLVVQIHDEYQHVQDELAQVRQWAEAEAAAACHQVTQLAKRAVAGEQLAQAHAREGDLLLSQLHQVQEELERYFMLKQELEQRNAELDAEKAAAAKAVAELHQKHEDTTKQLSTAQTQLEAEKAARAKAAVDFKAAAAREKELKELRDENELLLSQLHHVQEELERYYLDNQRLKQKLPPPKPPAPYGAALRIKRQLSYRLGATMIQRSRSVSGWLGMPWALISEIRAFRKERASRAAEKLPPIHKYCDAHEAERVKQHLSYRLGQTLLKNVKSPVGWIKLPFALSREVKQFRQQRNGCAV